MSTLAALALLIVTQEPSQPTEEEWEPSATQTAMLKANNAFRQDRGLPPHRLNRALCRAAQRQARWLAQTGRFSHRFSVKPPPQGASPPQRARSAGYRGRYRNEIIAWSSRVSVAWAFRIWRKSSGHYGAIVSPDSTQAGFGAATVNGRTMYVGLYGSRPNESNASSTRTTTSGTRTTYTPRRQPIRQAIRALVWWRR